MASSSATLHESAEVLGTEAIDRHRAIVSIMEELEAIDWYDQRVRAATDEELRQILAHNRDEEKEHAVMTLEWLRRHDAKLASELKSRLFAEGPIVRPEDAAEAGTDAAPETAAPDGSLGIGSLRLGGSVR